MPKEYVKFCFSNSKQNHYTNTLRKPNLQDSYTVAKKNMIRRLLKLFGKYNFTDVSFRLKGEKWSKISWKI